MLLDGRNAIIYGASGTIGGAVARAFGREGAVVHLVGRTPEPLEALAAGIRSSGGRAEAAPFDALSAAAVDAQADDVAARFGSLDISLNVIDIRDVQGRPLVGVRHDRLVARRSTILAERV